MLILTAVFWFNRYIYYNFLDPELAVFASPDGTKSAYLLWYGIDNSRKLTLFASNTSSIDDVLWIGIVDYQGCFRFNELLWFSDSSLVAARCYVHYALPEDMKDKPLLTHGYDFDSLDRHTTRLDLSDVSLKELIDRDSKLKQLFTQRGGQQSIVSKDNLHNHMKKLKRRQWRQWRARLDKAKERQYNK